MARKPVVVLGIDTSLRCSGFGVVVSDGMRHKVLEYGIIKNPASWSYSKCLHHIFTEVTRVIEAHQPSEIAIEGIFYCKNVKVALALGQARGAAIAACAMQDVPVYEYAARSVKKAITGQGAAGKDQVGKMVKMMLKLDEIPPEDAADALAIAMTHLHQARLGGQAATTQV